MTNMFTGSNPMMGMCVFSGVDQGSVSVCTFAYTGFDLIWDVMCVFTRNTRNPVIHFPVSRFIRDLTVSVFLWEYLTPLGFSKPENGLTEISVGYDVYIQNKTKKNVRVFQVLNEVVVDRGPSSYLSNVDLFLDGHLITTVQGDGECLDAQHSCRGRLSGV